MCHIVTTAVLILQTIAFHHLFWRMTHGALFCRKPYWTDLLILSFHFLRLIRCNRNIGFGQCEQQIFKYCHHVPFHTGSDSVVTCMVLLSLKWHGQIDDACGTSCCNRFMNQWLLSMVMLETAPAVQPVP